MKIELSEQALAIIARALSLRPYGEVAALIEDIERQIAENRKPPAEERS